jgi:hypothetical protein
MSTVSIIGTAMEWSGKALKRADIAAFIEEYAKSLLEKQAEEITLSGLSRILRSKTKSAERHVLQEFADVYKRQNFNAVMAFKLEQFDKDVLIPLVEIIEEYRSSVDKRFYALPKFLVLDLFENMLSATLRNAEGLPQVFDDVFGKEGEESNKSQTEELRQEKIAKFIEFASREAANSAIKALDGLCEPSKRFLRPLRIKSIRNDVYFWGQNPSIVWKEGKVRGHYYFDKRSDAPTNASLAGVESLKNKLEASLFQTGTLALASELESAIETSQMPTNVRNCLSVRRS